MSSDATPRPTDVAEDQSYVNARLEVLRERRFRSGKGPMAFYYALRDEAEKEQAKLTKLWARLEHYARDNMLAPAELLYELCRQEMIVRDAVSDRALAAKIAANRWGHPAFDLSIPGRAAGELRESENDGPKKGCECGRGSCG